MRNLPNQTKFRLNFISYLIFLYTLLYCFRLQFSLFFLFSGKTRTKDKYRVVYSDHQRLELEKEFHYTRYITIRRKSELAQALQLSERQVKIWFQNRRAKDRKQKKKMDISGSCAMNGGNNTAMTMPKYLDVNTKIEPFHLQHLQQIGIGVGLHSGHHHLHHSNLDHSSSITHPHSVPVTSTPLSINNNNNP